MLYARRKQKCCSPGPNAAAEMSSFISDEHKKILNRNIQSSFMVHGLVRGCCSVRCHWETICLLLERVLYSNILTLFQDIIVVWTFNTPPNKSPQLKNSTLLIGDAGILPSGPPSPHLPWRTDMKPRPQTTGPPSRAELCQQTVCHSEPALEAINYWRPPGWVLCTWRLRRGSTRCNTEAKHK